MPRSRRLRGRSRPRSAPPAPRSTGAGARPPLPPGPRRTGGSGRPVGGCGGGHTQTGWVLPAGPCSAAFPRRWQPEPVIIPRLLIIYPLPRPPAGRTQEPAVGDLEALPLSPPARGGPRGLDARSPCRAPPLRAAAARLRPLLLLLAGLRGTGGPFPGWMGGGTSGVPKGQGAAALPRPPRLCPNRPRSPQGSVPRRAPFPHVPVPRTGAGRGRPDSAEPRAGEAPLRPRRSGRSPRRLPAPRRIF